MKRKSILSYATILLSTSLIFSTAQADDGQISSGIGYTTTSSLVNHSGLKQSNSSKLDAKNVIFIFADLHPDLVALSRTMSPSSLAANAGGLAKVAKAVNAPSLFLTVGRNGKPGEVLPELKPYSTADNTIYRENADPFQVKKITDFIKKSGKTNIVVSGYSSDVAVILTSLGGLENGYNVFIPVDCIGNRSARTEQAALAQANQAGAHITSLDTVAAQLAPDFSKEPGTTILSVILNSKL